jgi:hypothetical protein
MSEMDVNVWTGLHWVKIGSKIIQWSRTLLGNKQIVQLHGNIWLGI